MPPAPVPEAPVADSITPVVAPTALYFSDPLRDLTVVHPDLKFRTSSREAPQSARFRLAVDSLGVVRYTFLEESSGDAALDAQARHDLALSRFQMGERQARDLVWATATFEFGSDLEQPPSAAGRAP